MENKVASLENIDELENESPRSLFSSSVSELPTVRDFSFIKPIAKGGYRCESFLLSPFSFLLSPFSFLLSPFLNPKISQSLQSGFLGEENQNGRSVRGQGAKEIIHCWQERCAPHPSGEEDPGD